MAGEQIELRHPINMHNASGPTFFVGGTATGDLVDSASPTGGIPKGKAPTFKLLKGLTPTVKKGTTDITPASFKVWWGKRGHPLATRTSPFRWLVMLPGLDVKAGDTIDIAIQGTDGNAQKPTPLGKPRTAMAVNIGSIAKKPTHGNPPVINYPYAANPLLDVSGEVSYLLAYGTSDVPVVVCTITDNNGEYGACYVYNDMGSPTNNWCAQFPDTLPNDMMNATLAVWDANNNYNSVQFFL